MQAKKPTIDDVARLSGVGRTTVSRVLNGGPNVRDAVRVKVMEAVAALDYRVNPQARSLAGGGSRLLALIFASDLESEPNSFYHSALELGALRGCLRHGYHLLTRHVPRQTPERTAEVLDLIETQRCEGMILTPPYSDDAGLIAGIQKRGCRVVAISPGGAGLGLIDGIGMDDEAGGYEIVRHLLDLGHRRFGFIGGIAGHLSANRRLDGLKRALSERGLGDEAVVTVQGDFTFRSGVNLAPVLLDHSAGLTALVCANDDMAAGALSVVHGRGLDVPGEISVTGFDDTPVSAIVWPPLTTVHQPLKEMGERAVDTLVARLNGLGEGGPAGGMALLEHVVVTRGSTGAPFVRIGRKRD